MTDPRHSQLTAQLREQNETAASLDRAVFESGNEQVMLDVHAQRRYAGPTVGDRVIIIELIVRTAEQIADPDYCSYNLARIEALTWDEALSMGQIGHYSSSTFVVEYRPVWRQYYLRIDQHSGRPDVYEGQRQIVGLTVAESLREGDQLMALKCDEDGWEFAAEKMVAGACERACRVQEASIAQYKDR